MSIFKNHGTKILGSLTAITGILATIDPAVLEAIIGKSGVGVVIALSGIATIWRGFTNSANLPQA